MKNIIFLIVMIIFNACSNVHEIKDLSSDNKNFIKKILNDSTFFVAFEKTFEIENAKKGKVFKVVLSRRNRFLRITTFQIFHINEIRVDMPHSFFVLNNQVYLVYNGSEILYGSQENFENIITSISELDLELYDFTNDGVIRDSKIFQVDIDLESNLEINFPPLQPYDENDKLKIIFKPPPR